MRYKILIVIVIFFYVYPIFLGFFPLPLDRLIQLVGFSVFLFTPKFRIILLRSREVHKVIIGATLIVFFAFIAQAFNYSQLDFYFIKIAFDTLLYFFSAYLVIYLIHRFHSDQILSIVFRYLILVFILQACLSLFLFLNPSFFDIYISLLKQDNNENFMDRLGLLEKRLIGIGSGFFLGVAKYGVGFFVLVCLPFVVKLKSKIRYTLITTLLIVAGVMTGRTFFVAILLGLGLFVLIDRRNSLKFIFRVLPLVLIMSMALTFMSDTVLDSKRLEVVSNYVLEIFRTYEETGDITTSSSEATLSMYVFPESMKTWLIGDGRMIMSDGSYYMRSDVGYVRLIFYFGIIFTVVFFLIKLMYTLTIIKLTKDKSIKLLFATIFVWTLVLNLKGLASLDQFTILFLLALIYDRGLNEKKRGI